MTRQITQMSLATGLFLMFPGTLEAMAYMEQRMSNMAREGVYFDIQRKRDYIYILGASTFMLSFTHVPVTVLRALQCLIGVAILSYFRTVAKWQDIIC